MYTLPAYIGDASVLCVLGWEEASGESFRSTTGVYSRPSQLFINKILYIRLLSVVCLVSSVLMSTSTRCDSLAPDTTVLARPPAGAPAGGCVACRVPAPGLPPSSPMPRGPPPRAPPFFPESLPVVPRDWEVSTLTVSLNPKLNPDATGHLVRKLS